MSGSRISVAEAEQILSERVPTWPAERVSLIDAADAVLREDIRTDRPLPPFDRVTMDGIAVWAASGTRTFRVEATQYAGQPPVTLQNPGGGCIQVMTGAVLPVGSDCVIPYEEIELGEEVAVLHAEAEVGPYRNVHRLGTDRARDEIVLRTGTILRGPHQAILASVGRAEVLVGRRPRTTVISSGDELVEPGGTVLPHQIRRSNSYGLAAMLHRAGVPDIRMEHLHDDPESMTARLRGILDTSDLVVLSGGVSAGRRDHVPAVLGALGVETHFHRVRQRPGGPFWFGTRPGGPVVFALPGNPVSALTGCRRYVMPHVLRAMGAEAAPAHTVVVGEEIAFAPPLVYLPPVRLKRHGDGGWTAVRVAYHGSGDLSSLAESSGFVELAAERERFPAGSVVPYYAWDH